MSTSDSYWQIKELFAAVLEKPLAERNAFLEVRCANDATLRSRIQELLELHERASLIVAPDSHPAAPSVIELPSERPGDVIGPYKLLQLIGEGGFGRVYMAEQESPVRRRVALKIIKLGMDTRQVIARFAAERQALAMMDHPGIAKVFDAGATETGRPYFVMELVKGSPITEYCDKQNLGIARRLGLFVQVCHAVQHAHQKGLIHRDIKPSNVLVCAQDDRSVVRVIDFGIAKATQARLTEQTLFTEFRQLVGTPEYMSPEQAEGSLDVDTRSDVYSLGVLLYELLTGTTPFDAKDLRSKAYAEIQRIIREVEPPTPSTRLSQNTDTIAGVAAHRHTEPRKLAASVRGELDWIAMKCLEKDRSRRYESASGIAMEIDRYLKDDPVEASPPSATYRLRKLAHKYRGPLRAATVIAALLVAATIYSAWQAVRATRAVAHAVLEQRRADHEAITARRITESLQQLLGSADPNAAKGPDYTVRQLLDDYADSFEGKLADQPEVAADLHATIGKAYAVLGQREKGRKHLARALELRRIVFGNKHEQYADILVAHAWPDTTERSQYAQGEADLREALAIYRARGVGGKPVIQALWMLRWNLGEQGKPDQIEPVINEALAEARRFPSVEFEEIASLHSALAGVRIDQSQYAEAENIARDAVAMHLRMHGPDGIETAWGYFTLGEALRAQGKFAEALATEKQALMIMRKVFPPEHRSIAIALNGLHLTLKHAATSHALAGMFPSPQGLAEYESLFREVLVTTKPAKFNNDDPAVIAIRALARFRGYFMELSNEFAAAGKAPEAEESREAAKLAVQRFQSQLSGNSDLLPFAHCYSAIELIKDGQPEQAKELAHKLLAQPTSKTADAINILAWFLATAEIPGHRDPALAVELANKAVAASPQNSFYHNTLGIARYRAGDFKGAVSELQDSISLGSPNAFDLLFLAMAHHNLGNIDAARRSYAQAMQTSSQDETYNPDLVRFRIEAEELLGVSPTTTAPMTAPASPPRRSS